MFSADATSLYSAPFWVFGVLSPLSFHGPACTLSESEPCPISFTKQEFSFMAALKVSYLMIRDAFPKAKSPECFFFTEKTQTNKQNNSFTFQTPTSILQKHMGDEEFQNTSTSPLLYFFAVSVQQ